MTQESDPMTERKLALHSLKGDPVAYYQLTMLTTHTVITTQATRPCHHLVLVDRVEAQLAGVGHSKQAPVSAGLEPRPILSSHTLGQMPNLGHAH